MTSASRQRPWLLGGALLLSLGLTAWVTVNDEAEETATVELAPPSPRKEKPRVAETKPAPLLPSLARTVREKGEPANDLFAAHTWYVAPPPSAKAAAAAAEPPPPPVAPAVPYAYMGKLEDTPDGTLYMLTANNKLYTVRLGETLDRTWRLDREDGAALQFTYLPLALPKALAKTAKLASSGQNNNQGMTG